MEWVTGSVVDGWAVRVLGEDTLMVICVWVSFGTNSEEGREEDVIPRLVASCWEEVKFGFFGFQK